MQKRWLATTLLFAAAITAFGLAGCGTSGTSQQSSNAPTQTSNTAQPSGDSTANAQVVHVTATNFKWTLDKTEFTAKQPIEFDISDKEGMHGFTIDGTNVNQPIGPGDTKKITWTPPKAGTYTIRCNIYCGSGHDQMITTFQVK